MSSDINCAECGNTDLKKFLAITADVTYVNEVKASDDTHYEIVLTNHTDGDDIDDTLVLMWCKVCKRVACAVPMDKTLY
jgi:hypothetical protein